MNLLLLEASEAGAAAVRLAADDRRARHIVRVLRSAIGDTLRVGVICGARGLATVTELDEGGVTLTFGSWSVVSPAPRVSVALALPRPKALTRVLAAAASFGVREIVLLNAWRVDKSYWSSPRLHGASTRRALLEGCEQGQQTWLPSVQTERLLMPYLQRLERSGALERPDGAPRRLIAHPDAEAIERVVAQLWRPSTGDATGLDDSTLIAIGPEGGWIADEVAAFERAGFRAVSLGAATLRSHDATVAALAQLALLQRSAVDLRGDRREYDD